MELTPEEKEVHIQTAQVLKGSERRMYMARVVKMWGRGGQAQQIGEPCRGRRRGLMPTVWDGIAFGVGVIAKGRADRPTSIPGRGDAHL